jgi:hypothetical protein
MIPGVSPVNVTECEITGAAFKVEREPKEEVVPYSTCELEGWSVVHVIVANVVVIPLALTPVIVGIVAGVEKLKLAEVAVPAESVDIAA